MHWLLLLLVPVASAVSLDECYTMVETSPMAHAPVNCEAKTQREADGALRAVICLALLSSLTKPAPALGCFLLCGMCAVPALRFGLSAADRKSLCAPATTAQTPGLSGSVVKKIIAAVLLVSNAHGYNSGFANVTDALGHLLQYMSRADTMVLLTQPFLMIDFLLEHVNLAAKVRGGGPSGILANVSYELWRENVLPFQSLDEKRDLYWRWRPTFYRTFSSAPEFTSAKTITEAVKGLASLIPIAAMQGSGSGSAFLRPDGQHIITSVPVTWHTGMGAIDLSSQEIVENGGSCSGTAVLLAAVLRSVGIPCRVTGCSDESAAAAKGNDHHWVEYWDPSFPGPFGDAWHTKEGVSKGNAGGPWDGASGPMNGCMRGLVGKNAHDMIYSASWSSKRFMPTLWGMDKWSKTNRWKGGIPRCKSYCSKWGCGVNQSSHYNTSKEGTCEPPLK